MKRALRSSTDSDEADNMTLLESPTKRRKMKGIPALKPKKGKFILRSWSIALLHLLTPLVTWPPNRLPVEIFTLIVSYLPRSNIQHARLVNKEFDRKVSEALFRVVVVPFRPEIYGITPEPVLSSEALQGSIMLQDKGMRVFQGYVLLGYLYST